MSTTRRIAVWCYLLLALSVLVNPRDLGQGAVGLLIAQVLLAIAGTYFMLRTNGQGWQSIFRLSFYLLLLLVSAQGVSLAVMIRSSYWSGAVAMTVGLAATGGLAIYLRRLLRS